MQLRVFSPITKWSKFCDFLFVSLHDVALPKRTTHKEFAPKRENSFLYGEGHNGNSSPAVAQLVKRRPTNQAPSESESLLVVNGLPSHTASHYHPPVVLI